MSITLSDGTNTATISNPQHGYESSISMPITLQDVSGALYGTNDDGSTYDMRFCRGLSFLLPAAEMELLADLLRDIDKGRGVDLTLSLGATPSGIFPFLPDKGDVGDFVVRVTRFEPGGQKHAPWMYWTPTLDLALITAPAYSIVDNHADGSVQIGSVTGIRYPQAGYDVDVSYKLHNLITQASAGQAVDLGAVGDTYESSFVFTGNAGKIGSVVNHLVATVRAASVSYIAPANNYAFGRDKAATATHTVQILYSERERNRVRLTVRHDGFDHFSMPLKMRFVS